MTRLTAKDFSPELLQLYDGYAHGRISKREFLDRAARFAAAGMTAPAILAAMSPNYALAVTTANVHDAAEMDAILPEEPGETYGDSAYAGGRSEAMICARGGVPQVVDTGTWRGAEALARLETHNARVRRVRCRIEKVFAEEARSAPTVPPNTPGK